MAAVLCLFKTRLSRGGGSEGAGRVEGGECSIILEMLVWFRVRSNIGVCVAVENNVDGTLGQRCICVGIEYTCYLRSDNYCQEETLRSNMNSVVATDRRPISTLASTLDGGRQTLNNLW